MSFCGMQEQGEQKRRVATPPYSCTHFFVFFGWCLVMRKGLLWQCKMLEKQKEAVE